MNGTLNIPNVLNDYEFSQYQQRQAEEISPVRVAEKIATIKMANNFYWNGNTWEPNSYEGFGILTMLSDNLKNTALKARLIEIQNELYSKLEEKNDAKLFSKIYQLPANSYHQTIANLLSNDRLQKNIIDHDLEFDFPHIVQETFDELNKTTFQKPIPMKMTGLSVFGTCIAMIGTFDNLTDYQRIIDFRKDLYRQKVLTDLDIKITRPFIGHITLSYFEGEFSASEKDNMTKIINEINEKLINEENIFYINLSSLRRFHHLAEFVVESNFPQILI